MTISAFNTQVATWICFPEDVRDGARDAALFLEPEERNVFARRLEDIHQECRRIEEMRTANFAAAERELDSIRHKAMPKVLDAIERKEQQSDLAAISSLLPQ